MFDRVITIVMDSVGVGHAPDATNFGDEGANTIGHIEAAVGPIYCPHLRSLGLGAIAEIQEENTTVRGAYGVMRSISTGKDTTSGHWEMMGVPVDVPFPTFYEGFPKELMDTFTEKTGYGYLGNCVASGTVIIEELGAEHIQSGKPIIYTSADSVFQIAAHESVIPLEELYRICQVTRDEVCVGPYAVGRIIARPFIGEPGHFTRTAHRHDYSRLPLQTLDTEYLQTQGIQTIGVGKINDIYASVGIDVSYPTTSNEHGMEVTQSLLTEVTGPAYIMVNLVDFDSQYGHRRDPQGYKEAIERFDVALGTLLPQLKDTDLLCITADHGNDPTWKGTDHTREEVPLLVYSPRMTGPIALGTRSTFADLGATILDNFDVEPADKVVGKSFLSLLLS